MIDFIIESVGDYYIIWILVLMIYFDFEWYFDIFDKDGNVLIIDYCGECIYLKGVDKVYEWLVEVEGYLVIKVFIKFD